MSYRIWYPQLDVYDCIRRLGLLLTLRQSESTSIERILIADFFLANPPLLHGIHMPRDVRSEFRDFQIPRPEKGFLTFPAPPLLFHKMAPIQNKALRQMAGKGLFQSEHYEVRRLALSDKGYEFVSKALPYSDDEREIAVFIAQQLTTVDQGELEDLRQRTGLRRLAS